MFTTETAREAGRKGGKAIAKLSAADCICPFCGGSLSPEQMREQGLDSLLARNGASGGNARAAKYSREEMSAQVKKGKCGRPKK